MTFSYDDNNDVTIAGGTDATTIGNQADSAKTIDFVNTSASYGALTVGTSAVAARVGVSNLTNRRYLLIMPRANSVFLGWNSSVTTSNGMQLFKDQMVILPIGPGLTPFLIADAAGKDVRISELA